MLKYTDTQVCFQEVPDEITLCINISNCPCHCEGCHSAYLADDIGKPLTEKALREDIIGKNRGITCIAFMGGDSDPGYINKLARWVRINEFRDLKIAWYSGRQKRSKDIDLANFDFIKLGPYDKDRGPINNRMTNQRLYKVAHLNNNKYKLIDITYKFWKGYD